MTTAGEAAKRKRFLVVKGSGGAGLGDKIRALPSAILYARLTGRQLYVDWNDPAYGDGRLNYFPHLFELREVSCADSLPVEGSVRPTAWRGKLHLNWDQLYAEFGTPAWSRKWAQDTFSFDQGCMDWDENILVMWDFDQFEKLAPRFAGLYPECQGRLSPEAKQGVILKRHLRLSADMELALQPWMARLDANRPVIGVHVRAAEDNFRMRLAPPVDRYMAAVERLSRKEADASIFLATDNSDVEKFFRKRFGEGRVHTTRKWLPPPGVALQLGNACPDRLQSAREALIDIQLLASCETLVTMNNSSFSILARMFSQCPAERQIVLSAKNTPLRRVINRISRNVEKYL
jgi:hypothetical protein